VLAGFAPVLVRINAAPEGGLDVSALAGLPVDGIVVPKVAVSDDLSRIRQALRQYGSAPRLPLVPQVESAAGVLGLEALLQSDPHVAAVAFGREDFAADLGVPRSPHAAELAVPRARMAMCARAAGLPAIDTVYTISETPKA